MDILFTGTKLITMTMTITITITITINIIVISLIISSRIKRDSPSGEDRQGDVAQDGAACLSAITQLLGKSGLSRFMCIFS